MTPTVDIIVGMANTGRDEQMVRRAIRKLRNLVDTYKDPTSTFRVCLSTDNDASYLIPKIVGGLKRKWVKIGATTYSFGSVVIQFDTDFAKQTPSTFDPFLLLVSNINLIPVPKEDIPKLLNHFKNTIATFEVPPAFNIGKEGSFRERGVAFLDNIFADPMLHPNTQLILSEGETTNSPAHTWLKNYINTFSMGRKMFDHGFQSTVNKPKCKVTCMGNPRHNNLDFQIAKSIHDALEVKKHQTPTSHRRFHGTIVTHEDLSDVTEKMAKSLTALSIPFKRFAEREKTSVIFQLEEYHDLEIVTSERWWSTHWSCGGTTGAEVTKHGSLYIDIPSSHQYTDFNENLVAYFLAFENITLFDCLSWKKKSQWEISTDTQRVLQTLQSSGCFEFKEIIKLPVGHLESDNTAPNIDGAEMFTELQWGKTAPNLSMFIISQSQQEKVMTPVETLKNAGVQMKHDLDFFAANTDLLVPVYGTRAENPHEEALHARVFQWIHDPDILVGTAKTAFFISSWMAITEDNDPCFDIHHLNALDRLSKRRYAFYTKNAFPFDETGDDESRFRMSDQNGICPRFIAGTWSGFRSAEDFHFIQPHYHVGHPEQVFEVGLALHRLFELENAMEILTSLLDTIRSLPKDQQRKIYFFYPLY